ncbi:MAG: phosphomannomutase/phosphoglucomutase [Candidatus Omnitrophica bacterium]|nr:phosphomannomutase/phosphoglucomutase [Candidatus Omnitrophota bacterium]MDD5671263.1 phosphomannomutase/phosphoglucomutase [Candidatus Omnitrophota bacterium]
MSGIFKAYDVRGKYPEEVNETTAQKIGAAFVRLLSPKRMVIGHDSRCSSPALSKAFIAGAATSEVVIADVGLTTSPALYDAIIEGAFDAGVMVTASHLPAEMNGFKLCREKAIPLSGDEGLPALESLMGTLTAAPLEPQAIRSSYEQVDRREAYVDKLSRFVHRPQSLKIVIDAGNGSAGPELALFLKKFPMWDTVTMYMEPDGRFPHHVANPLIVSTTRDLQSRVVQEKAAIGIAFDGDADRCGFIDETGERISQDLITALVAEFVLSKNPGATILYDLRSSRVVPETILRLGGRPLRCRVGHSFIKATMRKEQAAFAGELSGHYYYRDTGYTDNALMTMIQILNLLSLKGGSMSGLIAPLRKYVSTGELNFAIKEKQAVFKVLEDRYPDAKKDFLDGLTVEYDTWWFNLRASNTEPAIRLNLEADNEKILLEKKREVIELIRRFMNT